MPIGLRVFDGREVLFGAELGDELMEALVTDLHPVVSDECLWYAESRKHVLFVETKDVV